MKPLRIGQVASAVGVTVETVRYYSHQGLLTVSSRSAARYRRYDESSVNRLKFILRAKEHGFTLKEIKAILDIYDSRTATRADVREVIEGKIVAVEMQIRQLKEYEGALERLRSLCNGDGPLSECPIIMTFSGSMIKDQRTLEMPATILRPQE
jgi:MerR family transcriptional regulator, copper efflux regulator